MLYKKFTSGFVEQTFNDAGECIKQEFKQEGRVCCGFGVEWETEDGDTINMGDMPLAGREYFPFDMKQPSDDCYKEG